MSGFNGFSTLRANALIPSLQWVDLLRYGCGEVGEHMRNQPGDNPGNRMFQPSNCSNGEHTWPTTGKQMGVDFLDELLLGFKNKATG